MASILLRSVLFVIFTIYVFGDEIEIEVQSNRVLKMLREMVNQTTAESLNLPANATSIRENITDTFSCENRTYGYYADVDNECQLFHVCVPVQLATGRNLTFKYSFICPKETMFNQEVLVCARPRESIPCEESSSFYDLNMEIGKIADPDKEDLDTNMNKQTENIPPKGNANKNRNQNRKKQNIIMDALLRDAEEQMGMVEELDEKPIDIETEKETKIEMAPYTPKDKIEMTQYKKPEAFFETSENKPELKTDTPQYAPHVKIDTTQYYPQIKTETQYGTDIKIEPVQYYSEVPAETVEYNPNAPEVKDEFENSRLGSERSRKRTGRKIWRGSMKYKIV
ncbi:uncharacterized protein LOC123878964 [Maniola jurtina]|uniref:uncharacterized protein LOC123878964 n=1 Tax=Maniola jurtina TaxID=191418 RepID=UPI001E68C57D|nr:uncharacterized protein LOC123878964 [Maniola jurtina]